eukprot:tig00000093_g3495.t1
MSTSELDSGDGNCKVLYFCPSCRIYATRDGVASASIARNFCKKCAGYVSDPVALFTARKVALLEVKNAEAAKALSAVQKPLDALRSDIVADYRDLYERCCLGGEEEARGIRADVRIVLSSRQDGSRFS